MLEGFHPLKHALRFGAPILEVVSDDPAALARLTAQLAPDLTDQLRERAREIDSEVFAQLSPLAPTTAVMALAQRSGIDLEAVLGDEREAPVILLEDPRDLGNIGACVRVAAAADAAAVLSSGSHDPWHPDALRGSAGLHFALPVGRIEQPAVSLRSRRPLLAIDPDGEPFDSERLDPRAILAFGTERHGLSDELLARADARIRIPMRAGVSSLNLATSVAAVLFAWRLSATSPPLR